MRSCVFILIAVTAACTPPSEQRAELDRQVGMRAGGGVEIAVDDGLAAVTHLDEAGARLWCSAPELVIRLRSDASRPFELELFNTMRDARIVAIGAAGEAMPLEEEDLGTATRKRAMLDLSAGDNVIHVTTSDHGDRAPWRFALMSDVQSGIGEVQDLFRAMNAEEGLRFLLGAGDLSSDGTREELERFQDELLGLRVPYYTTLGNHDSPQAGLWQEMFGRGNFRFVFRGVQFTMLDSASATVDPLAYAWLDGWLDEGLSRVHLFAMHIPALDPVGVRNAAFGSRNEAGKLLSSLYRGNVAMTLYGHIHSFYQYDNAGIQAFISGGGGAYEERLDGYTRHYLVIEVGADAGIVNTDRVAIE